MGSRAKKKARAAAERGEAAMKRAGVINPGVFAGSGYTEVRRELDAAFMRSVEARRKVLSMLEQDKAMQDRAKEIFEEGRKFGFRQAGWPIIKSCLAAACVTLQEAYGMEEDEIVRGLTMLHEKITWALTNKELEDEALEKTGIRLQLDDPLEAVQHVREA